MPAGPPPAMQHVTVVNSFIRQPAVAMIDRAGQILDAVT
jgi:hypothetical protein